MKKIAKGYHIIIFSIGITIIGCTSRPEPIELDSTNLFVQPEVSAKLTGSQFKNSNMKLGKMEIHNFYQSINANGSIDVPPENTTTISTFFGGYVKELTLLPGQSIKKGQVLFTLENPEYIQMQQDYLESKGQLNYLKNDFERQKVLMEDKVTSEKKFLKAESDYNVLKAKYESLRRMLGLINIDPDRLTEENIRSTVSILSPLTGYVSSINVSKGMFITPSFEALTITNTEHLHLELKIFEKDLPVVQIGQPIKFRTQNNTVDYDATVFLINKSIDMKNRTISIHGDLTDSETEKFFTPGMYVEARILTSNKQAMALPLESVVNIDDKYFVLEKVSKETGTFDFQRREVEVGITVDDFIEIINFEEFDPNTEFLVKGAFNLIRD